MFRRRKYENSPKCTNQKAHSSKIEAKCIQTSDLGQNTIVTGDQVHQEAHTPKMMASHADQGAAAPWVRHRPQLHLAPPFSGGAFNARGGGCMRCFLKYLSKPTILKL